MNSYRKVSVVGLGYIGLPTAAMFASRKIAVLGVDTNPHVVETINEGRIHIVEPDLSGVVYQAVNQGYLRASTSAEHADAFLIAVPTPFIGEGHRPDLSYIKAACKTIAAVLKPGNLVVLESTSPVGATEQMADWLAAERPDLRFPHAGDESADIRIAHCPERVLPGKIMRELVTNDRIIGGVTPNCAEAAVTLYKSFVSGECVVASNPRVAEMAKLAENSFRDVNIAFANELSIICDHLSINANELISLANLHPRVNILQPGPGVGGHCIAVDPWFIVDKTPDLARIIRTARDVNDEKPIWVAKKIMEAHQPGQDIILYGLAYKPDVDDLRESPAIEVINQLRQMLGNTVRLVMVEPHIKKLPQQLAGLTLTDIDNSMTGSATRVLLVAHSAFRARSAELHDLGCIDFCNALKA